MEEATEQSPYFFVWNDDLLWMRIVAERMRQPHGRGRQAGSRDGVRPGRRGAGKYAAGGGF